MSSENLLYEQRIKQLETELQKAIATSNECKKEHDEFIYIAAHDLQAPLRQLSTFVERLTNKLKEDPGEEVKSYVRRIVSTVTDMQSLINSLVDLSTITETTHVFEKCDLNELIKNILKDIQPLIAENNTIITCSSLPVIEGDCPQLKYLFKNLVTNSIKFQKKDAPLQIKITSEKINQEEKKTFNLPAGKIYYKIEVTDNGIGFDKKFSEKIFQPFQRLQGKSGSGNGIGLAICKKIMEKHHGVIYAEGSENAGARFIVILPETYN